MTVRQFIQDLSRFNMNEEVFIEVSFNKEYPLDKYCSLEYVTDKTYFGSRRILIVPSQGLKTEGEPDKT